MTRKKPRLPWKPVFPASRREQKKAEERKHRPDVRAKTFTTDGGRCFWPTCRRVLSLEFAHIHEVEWRSQGGSPIDLEITVTLCAVCHGHIHPRVGGKLKRMSGTRTDGFVCEEKQQDGSWVEV